MARDNYKKSEKVKMINPYTFVPVQKANHEDRDNAEQYYKNYNELLTGVLHCTLQVRTPLAIPDTAEVSGESDEHQTYPFYKINGQYAIPGSSIRGVLRSTYEAITNSCFSTMGNNTYLSRRRDTSEAAYEPGILELKGGKFSLYKADRYLVQINGYLPYNKELTKFDICMNNGIRTIREAGNNSNSYTTGDTVLFEFKSENHKKAGRECWTGIVTRILEKEQDQVCKGNRHFEEGKLEGILCLGEKIGNKHGESIFVKGDEISKPKDKWQENIKDAYDRLSKTKEFYQNKSINKNLGNKTSDHSGYSSYNDLNPENAEDGIPICIPIWYQVKEDGKIDLSFASIGRTTYKNTLNDLVGVSLQKCTDRRHLCEACLLFGMVGGNQNNGNDEEHLGMGSRIRVSDAMYSLGGVPDTDDKIVLKELGGPRDSYLPFYAKNSKGTVPENYDDKDVEISGRKYYWHHTNAETNDIDYKDDNKTKRNASMELVKPGAEFSFDIYYDGIKEEQLNKLLWVITLGENKKDSNMCHKLGHGKPLGLGSVKIIVKNNFRRVFDGNDYYMKDFPVTKETLNIDNEPGINKDGLFALKKLADMNYLRDEEEKGIAIDYPNLVDSEDNPIPQVVQRNCNEAARHQWYYQNKTEKNEVQSLPNITFESAANEQELYAYKFLKYPYICGETYPAKVKDYDKKPKRIKIDVYGQEFSIDSNKIVDQNVNDLVGRKRRITVKCTRSYEKDGETFYDFEYVSKNGGTYKHKRNY